MHIRSRRSTTRWFALGFSIPLVLWAAFALGASQRDHAAANVNDAAHAQIAAPCRRSSTPRRALPSMICATRSSGSNT
jgi:hypothetical protein